VCHKAWLKTFFNVKNEFYLEAPQPGPQFFCAVKVV